MNSSVPSYSPSFTNENPLNTFWAIFVCLCHRTVVCLSCLSVCNVGVLRPNGWMDSDATRYGGRPRPRLQCVGKKPNSSLSQKAAQKPPISAHAYCGQTVAHISNRRTLLSICCSQTDKQTSVKAVPRQMRRR